METLNYEDKQVEPYRPKHNPVATIFIGLFAVTVALFAMVLVFLPPFLTERSAIANQVDESSIEIVEGKDLARQKGCLSCHNNEGRKFGPSFKAIATKYRDNTNSVQILFNKLTVGGNNTWKSEGYLLKMPDQNLNDADANVLIRYILSK